MSDMRKCDRCGKPFATNSEFVGDEWQLPMQVGEMCFGSKPKYASWSDLCPGCARSFCEWFTTGKENDRE